MTWRSLWPWLVGIVAVEVLSFFVTPHPIMNGMIALALGVVLFALTIWHPPLGLSMIVIELLIGSKGALFKFGGDAVNDGGVSIRLIFFAAFFVGWFVWALIHKTWRDWRSYVKGRWMYVALATALIFVFFRGWILNDHGGLIVDANAWGFWLLLLPAMDLVRHARERVMRFLKPAILCGLIFLAVETLVFLFLFSHQIAAMDSSFYVWIRRTGLGEVTRITNHAFRIFMQSQVYAVIALFFSAAYFLFRHDEKLKPSPTLPYQGGCSDVLLTRGNEGVLVTIFVLLVAEVFVSLSRSYWVGFAAVGLFFIIFFFCRSREGGNLAPGLKQGWPLAFARVTPVISSILVGLLVVWLIPAIPPHGSASAFTDMIYARVTTNEKAVMSRWQLLPIVWNKIKEHPFIGSGFGSVITYQSADPRIVQTTGGIVTTYAIEWGWLEFWMKFGLLGILLMAWMLIRLGRRAWKSAFPLWLRVGFVASLIGLSVIHFFTPYLNHPLGFLYVILAEALIEEKNPASRERRG